MASLQPVSNASYWQYKDDTSYVLKWIDQTARACGWKRQKTQQTMTSPTNLGSQNTSSNKNTSLPTNKPTGTKLAPTSGRLKGKDRKAAKKQAEEEAAAKLEKEKRDEDERGTVLSALEILEQAKVISTRLPKLKSSVFRPPPSVLHALGRAINLRQSFSNWFEATRPSDHKSNSAHRYFVKVLEKIADLFLQATGTTIANSDEDDTGDANSDASRAGKQNRYEALLERVAQEQSEDGPSRPTESPGPSIKQTTTSGRKYHMEVKDSQENAFMVFTLFTDLHEIRTAIRSFWERCFKDGADMVVATLLTAQAMAFVERSEERTLSVLDGSQCQQGATGHEGPQDHALSFPGTYCRLLNTLRDPTDMQAVLQFEESSHKVGDEEAVSMNDLTFNFSARRLFFITRTMNCSFADPLLHQFTKDPQALLNSDLKRVLDRDRSLCCLPFGLTRLGFVPFGELVEGCPELMRQNWSVMEDPIIRYLTPLWSRHEVNLSGVFAAEVMLDIKELCSTFSGTKPSYHETFNRYMSLLGVQVVAEVTPGVPVMTQTDDSPLLRGSGHDDWREKVHEIMKKILNMLPMPVKFSDAHVTKEPQLKDRDVDCLHCLSLYTRLEPATIRHTSAELERYGLIERIRLSADTSYVYENYPIFVPNREAFMQTLTESVAIEVLNINKHVVGAMAHLYNASRQLGIGNLRWPAMDRAIELHKVALFVGDLPATPAAMLKTFTHRYWGPKGKMSYKEKQRRMNRAVTLMKPSAMTQAFNEHWDTAGRIPYWYALEANALAAATEKKAGKKTQSPTNPSFIDSIPLMEEYLTKQLQDVRVDYMEIDRVGVDFNNDLRKHAREKFAKQSNRMVLPEAEDYWSGIDFVSESFEQEAQLHEAMAKCGGDPSKLPVQDCDYLQDSINCLARALRAKGIGRNPAAADGDEGVNMPTSLTRFRIRGSEDLPDMSRLVLVSHCSCCHRKHYF